jgi:hypothetical protein
VSTSQQSSIAAALLDHVKRIRILERLACGQWIYVGDPGAPAFQNSFANSGGGLVPMRFRKLYGCGIEIEGSVTGGAVGDVVFTLPAAYAPDFELRLAASDDTGGFVVFRVLANGDVIFGVV